MNDPHLTEREQLIGNICIQWSCLEYMFATGIWLMIGVEQEVGKILTGNLDAKQRATMAHALAWQTNAPPTFKKAVKEVLDAMRDDLIHRRNEAVHGIHFGGQQAPLAEIELHRGKGGRAPRKLTNASLKELGDAINAAATKLANANIALVQKQASDRGALKEALELTRDILRNNSLTSEEGETKGPE